MGKFVYMNKVELAGVVGDYVTWGKATSGKKYCSFQLITNAGRSRGNSTSVEYIRVFVFNGRQKRMVDAMESAGFRRGLCIRLDGKLQSSKTEFRGQSIIQIAVHVNQMWVIDKNGNETEIK